MDTNKMFIDMARQAREFAETCCLMQKMPGMPLTAEVKDALGEYAKRLGLLKADPDAWREESRKKQAAGVKFDFRYGHGVNDWCRGTWDFDEGNKEDYREVQEAAEDAVEIRKWADRYYSLWCAIENNRAFALSPESLEIYRRYAEEVNIEFYGKQEVPQPIPHAAERALPKPTKLTAKIICKANIAYQSFAQDWEFYGTPEEYVAQCEKYGYVVVSEIKEVDKPKTVKHYFCMINTKRV